MSLRVLMLSFDKTLLGEQGRGSYAIAGDTIERHRKYGELVDELHILVTCRPGFEHIQLSDKVDVYPSNSRNLLGHLKAALRLAGELVKQDRLDLVVAQDLTAPVAWLVSKKYQTRYLVSFHGADFNSPEWHSKLSGRLVLPLVKQAVKRADGLRVVSPAMRHYFEQLGVACPIEVVPTPSDVTIFAKEQADQAQKIKAKYQDKKIILTDGRLEPVKNYPLLFEAVKLLVTDYKLPVTCLIIGSGSQEQYLNDLVARMKLSTTVEFLGSRPYQDLVPYYQACEVFALASDSESLGKVLLQAGASGKPVVTTRTVGAKSIVQNGKTGYLVETGDTQALAAKIALLLSDNGLRHKIGSQAQAHVLKNYDPELNTRKLVAFWHKIASCKI